MVITKSCGTALLIASISAAAACHSTPAAPPAPDAASSATTPSAGASLTATDASAPEGGAAEAGASAGPAWQRCLRRNAASDSSCGAPHGHFYAWDPQACSGGQLNIGELLQHCEANGPHHGMNIRNWCCP